MDMTLQQAMKIAADLEERGCLNEPDKAARTLLAHINSLASPQVTDEQILTIYQAVGFLEREGYYQIAGKLSLIHALLSAPPAAEMPHEWSVLRKGFFDVYDDDGIIYATVFNSLEALSYKETGWRVEEQKKEQK